MRYQIGEIVLNETISKSQKVSKSV